MFRKKAKNPPPASPLPEKEVRQYGPLTLAFVGDAAYSLLVRTMLAEECARPAGALHEASTHYVSAAYQARAAERLLPLLTEEEATVFKRGRNAHSAHQPKNQTGADYHAATGLEAVYGYLHLSGQTERTEALFEETVAKPFRNEQNPKG